MTNEIILVHNAKYHKKLPEDVPRHSYKKTIVH